MDSPSPHTHIHVHASTLADTHPINCSAFTVLPHVFFARSLQASWEAPGGTEGALELSKHPKWRSGEVPCSFVSTRLCQGNKCNTVCRLGSASSGVTMWLLGSRSQSRYHGLPLTAPLPWAARHSSPAAQLAALYQFNQPRSPTINQWWCTSVCVGRKVCSKAPLNSPTSTHTRMRNCTTHCTHTHTHQQAECRKQKPAENPDDSLSRLCKGLTRVCSKSQSTRPNFAAKMICAKQNHTTELGGILRGRTQLYLPVNNFPTSRSRTGAFDFGFMRACFTNPAQAKRNCTWQSQRKKGFSSPSLGINESRKQLRFEAKIDYIQERGSRQVYSMTKC